MSEEIKRIGVKEHLMEMQNQHHIRVRLNDGAELPGWAILMVEEMLGRISNSPLIDVWRISDGHSHYFTKHESEAIREQEESDECGGEIFITREKMLQEDFEALPEFMGF